MMKMPTEADRAELVAALRALAAICRAAKADKDGDKQRLDAGLATLGAVIHYLLGDQEIRDEHLTAPLAVVYAALHDRGQGAAVAMLDHQPDMPGKPRATMREHVQAHMAFALELLARGGLGTEQAAKRLAAEARRLGLKTGGGDVIAARQITSWRDEINRRKAPEKAREQFEVLRQKYRAELTAAKSDAKRKRCEQLAEAVLLNLANVAPAAAPKASRRLKQ
ncbi:MAG TPA: hypothetical protein VH020_13960 [Stellaceae bacterium]|jgi:hypothetical protein|nr:hypothetical protein [Stellaceae bacterium]